MPDTCDEFEKNYEDDEWYARYCRRNRIYHHLNPNPRQTIAPVTAINISPVSNNTITLTTSIRGLQYENRIKHLSSLMPNSQLELRRENDNQHDKNAIAIFSSDNKVGYIDRQLAQLMAPAMYDGIEFNCCIANVNTSSPEVVINITYQHGKIIDRSVCMRKLPRYYDRSNGTWNAMAIAGAIIGIAYELLVGTPTKTATDEVDRMRNRSGSVEHRVMPDLALTFKKMAINNNRPTVTVKLRSTQHRGRPLYTPFLQEGECVYAVRDTSITDTGIYIIDQYGYRIGHLPLELERELSNILSLDYKYPARICSIRDSGSSMIGNIQHKEIDVEIFY